ncbi:hypothetical protein DY000_02027924 [Brassica cretica]|uniref:RNB domain-containing protein n=1 Tax=Brassica cretica TaxID=69181 RepID=A0ABQ7E8U8_BRACR|nr:hypothetical protein DY000_02027924 [Brassica cretica]
MLQSKVFNKETRGGRLQKIDLLENQAIDNVVVLSVVLDEVKNRNRSMYNRIRALCSNQAKQFYVFSNHVHKKHLADTSQVLLVTNDRENERKATEEGISAETKSRAYVKSIGQPELLDLLAQPAAMEDADDSRPSKRKLVDEEGDDTVHLAPKKLLGIKMLTLLVLWSLEPMSLPGGTAHSLFVSKDRRIPRFALTLDSFRTFLDMRIVVAVDSWGCQSRYPSGHYVRPIGKIGSGRAITSILFLVLSCLPPLPWSVSAEDVSDPVRQDLRHLLVFSVDPSGISVYLVERGIDMLPKPLTEDICSLRTDVERLAFSVIWEMSPEVEITSTRFTKSIIKSSPALSYVEALARMDDRLCTGLISVIYCYVLFELCALASAEVKFQIAAETHDPLDIAIGLSLDVSSSKALADSLNRAVWGSLSFRISSLWACGTLIYSFYIPYPEISWLLAASLRIYKLPTVFQDRPQLTSVADNKPTDAETRVAKLRSNGFILFVPKYEIEGPVYVTAKGEKRGGDWYVDEENQKIV